MSEQKTGSSANIMHQKSEWMQTYTKKPFLAISCFPLDYGNQGLSLPSSVHVIQAIHFNHFILLHNGPAMKNLQTRIHLTFPTQGKRSLKMANELNEKHPKLCAPPHIFFMFMIWFWFLSFLFRARSNNIEWIKAVEWMRGQEQQTVFQIGI